MTVSTRSAVNPPLIGFKITDEWNDIDTCPFALGFKVITDDGNIYRLVRATAAKTAELAYLIDEAWLVGAGVTKTTDDTATVGIPHTTTTAPTSLNASATYTYFWIQTGGNFDVTPDNAVADGGEVKATGNAGYLDDGDDSGLALIGAQWTAAADSGSASSFFCAGELVFNN